MLVTPEGSETREWIYAQPASRLGGRRRQYAWYCISPSAHKYSGPQNGTAAVSPTETPHNNCITEDHEWAAKANAKACAAHDTKSPLKKYAQGVVPYFLISGCAQTYEAN
jgi:hypothetical protein